MSGTEPTKHGQDLIAAWYAADVGVKTARKRLNDAECALENAKAALGMFLIPKDAQVGEKFAIWASVSDGHGNEKANLVECTLQENGRVELAARMRR